LDNFKRGKTPMLIATDIAARGIDVDNITHVVNYDLTHEPETYVHRIGRTARAGASGAAVSFVDRDEMSNLRAIERLLKTRLDVVAEHPTYPASSAAAYKDDDREERGGEREGRQQHFGRSVPQGQGKPSRGQGGGAGKRSSAPARAERPQADRGSDRGGDRSHARGTDRGDRNGDRSNAGFARSAERPQAPRVASGDRPIARPVTSSSDRSAPQHPLNAQRGQRPAPAGASRQKRRF
jgi:ATP-dependent RNA helicase RhlE